MRPLLKINLSVLLIFAFTSIIPIDETVFGRITHECIKLITFFLLPGLNLTCFIQNISRKIFTPLEILTLSAASSLLIVPFILTLEYSKLGILFPTLPLYNAILIFLFTEGVPLIPFIKKNTVWNDGSTFDMTAYSKLLFSKEFIFPFILYTAIIISATTAYYPLPDSDPYYWASKYHQMFSEEVITDLSGDRPLFASLSYIFTIGMHVDFYAFFKYVLPSFLLLLLFPAALLAKKFHHPLQKAAILLFPFANGITIIYLTIPVPQALSNISFFFFFSLLSYSWLTKDDFFFFASGITIFLGYFYHEVMALPLLMWLLVTLIAFHRAIFLKIKSDWAMTILLLLLLLPSLGGPMSFLILKIQSSLIPALMNIHPNFLFPQYYVNVDGNQMGWGDWIGITKYYLFYIGPAIFTLFFSLFFLTKKDFRESTRSKEWMSFFLIFALFFTLAEIFPRILGLAFLPDRAWVLAGPTALFFTLTLFHLPIGKNKLFLWILIAGFSLNIGAALYINNMKKYVFTDAQMIAADWVKRSLPENRVLFAIENQKSLEFFSHSSVISIKDPNFYYNIPTFEGQFFSKEAARKRLEDLSGEKISEITKLTTDLAEKQIDEREASVSLEKISDSISLLQKISRELQTEDIDLHEHYYVYYATPNPKNPYMGRPYLTKLTGTESTMIFNQFPDRFKKIYTDEKGGVTIWEIL